MSAIAPPPPPAAAKRRLRMPGSGRLNTVGHQERAAVVTHLEEMRWRAMVVVGVLLAGFVAGWIERERLFELLQRPLEGRYPIQTLSVTEPFFTTLTVAAHAAFVIALPVAIYNLYRFVAPAMEPSKRRGLVPLVVLAPVLFGCGVVFCYLFILGPAVRFLLGIGDGSFEVVLRAQDYYGFVSMTLLGMGLAFLFPLALLGAARVGVLRAEVLRSNRKVAFVLIAIVAALLPTGDPVSLAIEIIPLFALFELSILLVALQERATKRSATS
jgi:sec-independent protein translocase protein TatC